jgi:hypothetical protein
MFNVFKFIQNTAKKMEFRITLRGVLLLFFLLLLLIFPIKKDADITATIIASALFVILLYAVFATLLHGLSLKQKLQSLAVQPPLATPNDRTYARKETTLLLKLPHCKILPLFNLSLSIHFADADPQPLQYTLKGTFYEKKLLTYPITFPHRGVWRISKITCSLQGRLGLSAFSWDIKTPEVTQSFKVFPTPVSVAKLPILSSFYKAGDVITASKERRGEPLDIKRYHPSDGIKKIVWKIFARSGTLMSRHQEAASSPEGQVAVFCFARAEDDRTAAAAAAYLQRLSSADLEIVFNCEGSTAQATNSLTIAEDRMVTEVWNVKNASPLSEVLTFVDDIKGAQHNAHLQSILLFFDSARLSDRSFIKTLTDTADILSARQIEPIFFMIGEHPIILSKPRHNNSFLNASRAHLSEWFFPEEKPPFSEEDKIAFLQLATTNNWRLFSEDAA